MKKLTADDPETKSADLIAQNVKDLRHLFPEAFTEDTIDFEVLKQLLGGQIEEREEKYGLNWHGKRAARQLALTPSTGTLRPAPEESVDWDTTKNLMIEGDNLEVLKLLQKSYAGKVKLIYIDPPYNTAKDFIYRDDFRDSIRNYLSITEQTTELGAKKSSASEESGRLHTDWLNMMYPRLKLAHLLLRSDGAIFVTIGDHELAQLKAMMDEIWGEENFIASIAWQKTFAKKNKATVSGSHDHVLLYVRNAQAWTRNLIPRDEDQIEAFTNPDSDPRGPWQSVAFSVPSEDSEKRKEYRYRITLPSGREVAPPTGRHWNGLPSRYEALRADNRLWFGVDGDNLPRQKVFLSEVQQGVVPDTWWEHGEAGSTQDAKKEILQLFGDTEPFSTPKPTKLIARMLQIASTSGPDIVMDFFAGSGTTGHAVYKANVADTGDRRYILVQLPEPVKSGPFSSIAEITKYRLRQASALLKAEAPVLEGDLGFRTFKLASSNIRAWEPNSDDIATTLDQAVENLRSDRTQLDILFELLLKLGLDLASKIEMKPIAGHHVHTVGAGALIACLAKSIPANDIESLALGIVAWQQELAPAGESMVVFRDSAFADDIAKSNLTAILHQNGIENVRSL